MNLADIRQRLLDALPLRIPRFDPNESPRKKSEELEAYILTTAWQRGELEEALHWAWEAQKLVREQWNEIEGWEPFLPTGRRVGDATKEQVAAAKRHVNSEVSDGLSSANKLVEGLGRQIRRLELDYEAASRAYTLMSGS